MVKLPDVEYTSYRHVHRRVQSDVAIAHFKFMMITKGLTDLERILFRSREQKRGSRSSCAADESYPRCNLHRRPDDQNLCLIPKRQVGMLRKMLMLPAYHEIRSKNAA